MRLIAPDNQKCVVRQSMIELKGFRNTVWLVENEVLGFRYLGFTEGEDIPQQRLLIGIQCFAENLCDSFFFVSELKGILFILNVIIPCSMEKNKRTKIFICKTLLWDKPVFMLHLLSSKTQTPRVSRWSSWL